MKNLILFIAVFTMYSCVATKYDAGYDANNFSKISTGNKYSVYDTTDQKTVMVVTSIEADTLRGTSNNLPFAIAKKDIRKIKKNQPLATAALVAGSTVVIVGIVATGLLIKEFSDGISGEAAY